MMSHVDPRYRTWEEKKLLQQGLNGKHGTRLVNLNHGHARHIRRVTCRSVLLFFYKYNDDDDVCCDEMQSR